MFRIRQLLALIMVLVFSTVALAFGGGSKGRVATEYKKGVDAIGVHFGDACPKGSSTTGQGGETGIYDKDVMCKCIEADKVYTVNGCESQPEICDNHTINQCGLGYYCQFSLSGCGDSDRGNGVCTAISGGTKVDGHWVGPKLDWWRANSWCIGKGSTGSISYATLQSEYACDKDSYACDWNTMSSKGLTEYYWSGEDYGDSCYAWYVYVTGRAFAGRRRNDCRMYTLCE